MTILELVENYLKRPENSKFGLSSYDRKCDCTIDDLAPCGDMKYDCELWPIVHDPPRRYYFDTMKEKEEE